MYNELNQQLEEAQQGVQRLKKIKSMLEELERQKNLLTNKVSELKIILEKEDLDVEKLEGKSLTHIFHSILGNLDENIEKERQEALAAKLKYDQAVHDLDKVKEQITNLTSERFKYQSCESKYNDLYTRKKELLIQSGSETAEKILELSEQMNQIKNHRKEVKEAISAGNSVVSHLDSALKSLGSAEDWGTWDLLGGGLISDLAKHSHIDDAKSEVDKSQRALSTFQSELADVKISNTINIGTDGFSKFADFFFDGLIADWCMQSRIHDSVESVNKTKEQVQQVLAKLTSMDYAEASEIDKLEREMNDFITGMK